MEIIGPLQLRVMHYIWSNGESTVNVVHKSLNEEPGAPKLAYTTILTVMRNLTRREILKQTPAGRSHMFSPLVSEESYKKTLLSQICDDFFRGDVEHMCRTIASVTVAS